MKNIKTNPKQFYKQTESFRIRLSLSYCVLLLLILVMGVTITQLSYRQVQKKQNQQNRLSLYAAIAQFDDLLANLENLERQLSKDASFNQMADEIAAGTSDFYYTAYLTQQVLKRLSPTEQTLPIKRSYLYFIETDQILSSAEFSPFDFFSNNTLKISRESAHFMRSYLLDSTRWEQFIPMAQFQPNNKNFLYIQPINRSLTYSPNKIQVLYCSELDCKKLMQIFSHISFYDIGWAAAYDQTNREIFHSDSKSPECLSPHILKHFNYKDQVTSYTTDQGTRLLITRANSYESFLNWYLVQPYEHVYHSLLFYRNLFFLITALAFFTGAILAWLLSVYNTIPYTHLTVELSAQQKLAASLHSMVEESRPALTESYLHKLLEGTVLSNEELAHITRTLNLSSDHRYQILCLQALFEDTKTIFAPQKEALSSREAFILSQKKRSRAMLTQIRQTFPDTGYILKTGSSSYAVLLHIPTGTDEEDYTAALSRLFTVLHTEVINSLQVRLFGGLGGPSTILSYLWKSFSQAKEALQISSEQKPFISYSDYENATDSYYFPEHLSVRLSGFLSSGNQKMTEQIFQEIVQENYILRKLPFIQQHWLLSDIRSTLYRKRQSLEEALARKGSASSKPLFNIIDQQFSQDISLGLLKNIALELCQISASIQGSGNVITQIQQYVAEHYTNADLSLTEISQKFNLTENYISSLFKKEADENFSSWLIRLRMAKAKELVIDSDLPLSQLYLHLGYTNAAAFRKIFKKTYGVSPKEMREKKGDCQSP